jgi:DNA-binding XRE family transcriptional regulator
MPLPKKRRKLDSKTTAMVGTIPILPQILKEYRGKTGLTQDEVTVEAGLPRVRLSQYECGANNPPPEHLLKLANFYNTPARVFIAPEGIQQIVHVIGLLSACLGNSAPTIDLPPAVEPVSEHDVALDLGGDDEAEDHAIDAAVEQEAPKLDAPVAPSTEHEEVLTNV